MTSKLFIAFVMFSIICSVNAQDEVFWSGSAPNGNWEWGSGCNANNGGNWYWKSSGAGNRLRPDCNATFNIVKFDNSSHLIMNLNSTNDFSINRLLFLAGTSNRTINSDVGRKIIFQNNNGACKIENYVAVTTHSFNVDIVINSGGNNMEINPVNGFLYFNNTIRNNSNNPINIYGNQQVTFSGDIIGTPGITINNSATVVYSGVSKTYTGTTTINSGTKLKISSNQTLANISLNGGTLEIDANVTLTITGTYIATGGTIDNKGTIKFAGGSVTFPGSAVANNGTANTLAGFEVASSGIVTINTLLRVTNSITISAGTLLLSSNDLRLSNATLNVGIGGTFDNGGENQIIPEGAGTINISGTFITRDAQGFVGSTTAIPSITPTLNAGSTIEYGLNGAQDVQGLAAPTYSNVTFSGSGTKTLISGNTVTGTVIIKDTAIFNSASNTFGGSGTNLTMTETSRLIVSGARRVPDMGGTYTLLGGTIEFAGNSNSHTARSPITYNNVVISGANVNGSAGHYTLNNGATFTVNSGGVFTVSDQRIIAGGASAIINIDGSFVTKDDDGFYGTIATSISPTNTILNLGSTSTIEYAGADQGITLVPATTAYADLTVSGTGTKTIPTQLVVGNNLVVKTSALEIGSGKTLTVTNNVVVNAGATMNLEDSSSLVQVNDTGVNAGNIIYKRNTTAGEFDYTYFSSPVAGQTLVSVSPNTKSDKFFSFNAAANAWQQESSSVTMDVGKGYIIRGIPPPPLPALPPGFYTAPFLGKPNNGIITTAINWNGDLDGTSNLIGNPYPSAIDADKFLSLNSTVVEGTIYFWTHNTDLQASAAIIAAGGVPGTGTLAYTADDYASYNQTGGSAAAPSITNGGFNTNIPNGKIAAGQAFFATSLLANGIVTFNNSMRRDNSNNVLNNSQFFKTKNHNSKTAAIEKHRIWLNFSNAQGVFKQTLIGYLTNATNQYDSRFDGISFDANEFADFYSLSQDKNLVIQGRTLPFDENDQVPLGFRTTIEGIFTINIAQTDGDLTNQAVFIQDKLTNTIFDLRTGAYTFTTKAGTFNERFLLGYTNKTLGIADVKTLENKVLVFNNDKQIKVNSTAEIIDNVTVYDLLGRQIFKKEKVNSTELSISNAASSQQMVLVKVTLQNGRTITTKIIF